MAARVPVACRAYLDRRVKSSLDPVGRVEWRGSALVLLVTVTIGRRKPRGRLSLPAVTYAPIRLHRGLVLCSFLVMGCLATPIDASDTDDAASTGGTTQGPETGQGGTTGGPSADSTDEGTTSGTSSSGSSEGSDDGGFIRPPDVGRDLGLPLGEACSDNDDCESERCFIFSAGAGGVCSECALDSDCMRDGGPGTCTVEAGTPWGVCGDGSAGSWCQSDAGCADELVCTSVFEGSPFSLCGECSPSVPCDGVLVCVGQPGAGTSCVEPGSVPDGGVCSGPDDGACESTHCTEALFMDNPAGFFLCGECSSDDDCEKTQTCVPAVLSQMSSSGSLCQDAP